MSVDINLNIDKTTVGLSNVDNTADSDKPVSSATLAELNLKVDKVTGKGLSTEDYTTAEKTKLAGIATGATANSSDAQLRDRATHTGTQDISTVTGLQEELNNRITSDKTITVNGETKDLNSNPSFEIVSDGGALTVGTTAIDSGTNGRILFQNGGVLQQNENFFWDNVNSRLSIGQGNSPGARLDIRAQGALSTDIAVQVRNSGNSQLIFQVLGDGTVWFRNNAGTSSFNWTGSSINFNNATSFTVGNVLGGININPNGFVQLSTAGGNFGLRTTGNISFGGTPVNGTGTNVFMPINGTPPTDSLTDRFLMYSADIVAGNAAPHFRTENGSVIKLYRQNLPTNPTTAEIATLLSNLGLATLT
jgi:hypothetical protein